MGRPSRILLYLLGLIGLLLFFSPAFPSWAFVPRIHWGWPLAAAALVLARAGWKNRKEWLQRLSSRKKESSLFLLILAMVLITHLFLLAAPLANLNADGEVTLRAAKAILSEGARPIYTANQFYQGAAISYAYALLQATGLDLHRSAHLANLLFFALALLLLGRVYRDITGERLLFFFFTLSLWESLLFITADTTRGFSLVLLLFAVIIAQLHGFIQDGRGRFFLMGAAGGLLFFQYQQALPMVALIFLAALATLLIRKPGGFFLQLGRLLAGFLLGALPHLLAELYNHFLNTRSLFLRRSSGMLQNLSNLKSAAKHALFHPRSIESGPLSWLFLGLWLAGLALSLWLAFRRRRPAYLLLAGISLAVILVSTISGVDPDNARFAMHFRLFTPLIFLVVVLPFSLLSLRWSKFKILLLVPLLAWNGFRFAGIWRTDLRFHGFCTRVVRMLDRSAASIIFGEFWFARRYQASLAPEKIVLSSSSFLYSRVYRSPGQYPPDILAACRRWEESEKGYLAMKNNEANLDHLLDRLGFRYRKSESGLSVLYSHLRPSPPIELFHLLSLVELWPGGAERFAAELEERPWERLHSLALEGSRLVCRWQGHAGTGAGGEEGEIWRMRLSWGGHSLELPAFLDRERAEHLLPAGAASPEGECTLTFLWRGIPLHRQAIQLQRSMAPVEPPPWIRTDLGDVRLLFLNMKKEVAAIAGMSFRPLDPSEQIFQGVGSEMVCPGSPVVGMMPIEILDEAVSQLEIEVLSTLDFDSLVWMQRFQQQLVVLRGSLTAQAIPLQPGWNRVVIPVSSGERLSIGAKEAAFFAAQESAGSIQLLRTGLLLLRLRGLDQSGLALHETIPTVLSK